MADQAEKGLAEFAKYREGQVKRISKVIERQRKKAGEKNLNFTAPDEEQLKNKLGSIKSPMIVFQGWSGTTGSPGTINYSIGIHNPDAFTQNSLYVHLFIGPANMVPDVGAALATVDSRFPRLTLPKFFGLSIGSGATETLSFSIPIAAIIEASNYLGNSFLFRADSHDVGDYFDRSVFPFEVT